MAQKLANTAKSWNRWGYNVTANMIWESFVGDEHSFMGCPPISVQISSKLLNSAPLFQYYRARDCFIGTDELFRELITKSMDYSIRGAPRTLETILKMGVRLTLPKDAQLTFPEYIYGCCMPQGIVPHQWFPSVCVLLERCGSWQGTETAEEYLERIEHVSASIRDAFDGLDPNLKLYH
jgi:hypothetical protein